MGVAVATKNDERYRHRLESYISMYTYVNGVRRRRHQYETVSYSFVFSQRFRNGSIKSVLHSIQKANCQNTVSFFFFFFFIVFAFGMNEPIDNCCVLQFAWHTINNYWPQRLRKRSKTGRKESILKDERKTHNKTHRIGAADRPLNPVFFIRSLPYTKTP